MIFQSFPFRLLDVKTTQYPCFGSLGNTKLFILPQFLLLSNYSFSDSNNTPPFTRRTYTISINAFYSPHLNWKISFSFKGATRSFNNFSHHICSTRHYWNHHLYDVKSPDILFILISLNHVYSLPFLISIPFFFSFFPLQLRLFMSFYGEIFQKDVLPSKLLVVPLKGKEICQFIVRRIENINSTDSTGMKGKVGNSNSVVVRKFDERRRLSLKLLVAPLKGKEICQFTVTRIENINITNSMG